MTEVMITADVYRSLTMYQALLALALSLVVTAILPGAIIAIVQMRKLRPEVRYQSLATVFTASLLCDP